jgi:NAD dependent epimerase/dehydratase family enzyme
LYGVVKKTVKTRSVHICIRVGIYGAINGQAICVKEQANETSWSLTCQKWEAVANEFQRELFVVGGLD